MRTRLLVVLIAAWTVVPAAAQVGVSLRGNGAGEPAEIVPAERDAARVVLSPGLHTPAGRAAMRAFREARAAGRTRQPSKASAPLAIGDTMRFNTQRFPAFTWQSTLFTLMAEGPGFRLWVQNTELDNGHVGADDVTAFADALGSRTPEGSVNPEAGILTNNTDLFGDVPDVDGDGILDVLWFNIRDLYPDPAGPIVFGYMAPEDYDPGAPEGTGNAADVLYVDTDPLLVDTDNFGPDEVAQVAVRVHQQLIHFNQDADEHPFVMRGLAEWARLLNGYAGSGFGSLRDIREHNIPFLFWSPLQPFFGDVQRSALFTAYLADQVGQDAVAALVREAADGADAYRALAADQGLARSVKDLVLDYHTANFVNDPALDPRFGYTTPAYREARAVPTLLVDASLDNALAPVPIDLRAGGILYATWENVHGLEVTLQVGSETPRSRVYLRAVLEEAGGGTSVVDLPAEGETFPLPGNFDRATVLLYYDELDNVGLSAQVLLSATWTGTAVLTENVSYEAGRIADEAPNYIQLAPDGSQATRFAVPPGARLARVRLAPYYLRQFNAANDAIRDFTLHVWADDGAGLPGDELLALTLIDGRPFLVLNNALLFVDLDLSAYPEAATLPDVVHAGFSSAGDDDNHVVLALAPLQGTDNPSAVYTAIAGDPSPRWRRMDGLNNEGRSLADRVVPIRVQFRNDAVRTDVGEDAAEVPARIALRPNYPNPFNPTTAIAYTLSRATHVRLAVYDLLGREVAVLVDAPQAAGAYEVPFDASGRASGLYVYRLSTDRQHLARTMVLLK